MVQNPYTPPFTITPKIVNLLQRIAKEGGILRGRKLLEIPLTLRRANHIKTIQSSLAIEGNTLSIEQITDLLNHKRVLGPAQDILEVKNALQVYEKLLDFDPLDPSDLLKAHSLLMKDLVEERGKWRTTSVGILKGGEVSHIAPPAQRVSQLMSDLFDYIKRAEIPWILKACVFHYELEFIHPFQDGNGRMGRLWQQLLLMKDDALFRYIPVEVLIKENQADYYGVLGESDRVGHSTVFIEFSLELILEALCEFSKTTSKIPQNPSSRLSFAKEHFQKEWFNRKEYMSVHQDISTATASRDLSFGIKNHLLSSKGEKNQMYYRFL